MQGTSGTYAVNNTDFTLKPTDGRWNTPQDYGFDGLGHVIYSAVTTFEMKWGLISPSELNQLHNFYLQVRSTGTVAVDLPQFGASQYSFYRYSGCTLSHLMVGEFFEGHYTDVRLLVYNVRT